MKGLSKVLFIGHDASRTGAPLLLLELMKWLGSHSSLRPSLLLKRGGEMRGDYQAVALTRCHAEKYGKLNGQIHQRVLRKLHLLRIRQPDWRRVYPPEEYPVVYANTVDTCDLATQLAGPGRRLIHHIHELSFATGYFGATAMLKRAIPWTDVYIAASHAVRDYLENSIGVPTAKVQVIHEFPIAFGRNGIQGESRSAVRRQLGIPEGAFVIGMCGSPQWRKGTDLFVQLAMHVRRQPGTAQSRFVWVGGDGDDHREPLHDVEQLGLQNVCHFIPATSDPSAHFDAFDLFALTSREDPFSVAMLEAAARGLPIVCFAGAGGAPELVENDAGIVVPYLDVIAMAKACVELLTDDDRRLQLGDKARSKVQSRYTLAVQGPKYLKILEETASMSLNPNCQ